MATIKAVIFDFIGTLTNVKDYTMEESKKKLCKAVVEAGFDIEDDRFLEEYSLAHEKYRLVRYQELVEVTNAVWISEALNNLGFKTKPEDKRIQKTVNDFFEDYLKSLELRQCARNMLEKTSPNHRLGLISNFTYAPVIRAGLERLCINQFFNVVLISQEIGWRKPCHKIFEEVLRRLEVKAEETVYVGDSPLEDVKGAKAAGMRTVFVPSQFYSRESLAESKQKPDLIVRDICDLFVKFPEFAKSLQSSFS